MSFVFDNGKMYPSKDTLILNKKKNDLILFWTKKIDLGYFFYKNRTKLI